ncbi:MAG: adenosine kinase [Micavibrio sp.]|nr:adenosine kinase [Micavibrio sp.]
MFDFCGIGNACVDIIAKVDDLFLAEWNFPKGICTYLTLEDANRLEAALHNPEYIPGGCAANLAACFSSLGGTSAFMGRVADDKIGRIFLSDMEYWSIRYSGVPHPAQEAGSTRIFCLITPDGERTFASFYGVQEDLNDDDLDTEALQQSNILYLDGYALNAQRGGETFLKAAGIAKSAGHMIAFSPNDVSILEKYSGAVAAIMAFTDIILCNETEAMHMTGMETPDKAIEALRVSFPMGAVTQGHDGAVVFDAGNIARLPAQTPPGPIINTNGAGDNFAGGFLFGLEQGYSIEKAGILGTLCAAQVLTRSCARPGDDYKALLSQLV